MTKNLCIYIISNLKSTSLLEAMMHFNIRERIGEWGQKLANMNIKMLTKLKYDLANMIQVWY